MNDNYIVSDGYIYNTNSDVINSNPSKVSVKNSKIKIIKILVIVLSVFLLLEVLAYTLVLPCFSEIEVSFQGTKNLSTRQLYNTISTNLQANWFELNTDQIVTELKKIPNIDTVTAEKRFPNLLFVSITERVPVAISLANKNGKTISYQIDKKGTIFNADQNIINSVIPLVTGLSMDNLDEGDRLHVKLRPIMEQIEEIQRIKPEYLSVISEIRVLPKEFGGYELMVYPMYYHTRVLMDSNFTVDSLQHMMVILDVMKSLNNMPEEIDLRYGSISYKIK